MHVSSSNVEVRMYWYVSYCTLHTWFLGTLKCITFDVLKNTVYNVLKNMYVCVVYYVWWV